MTDENGDKAQLPAMLMMNRNPDTMSKPPLAAPEEGGAVPDEAAGAAAEPDADAAKEGKNASSLRRRVEERLE